MLRYVSLVRLSIMPDDAYQESLPCRNTFAWYDNEEKEDGEDGETPSGACL